jgi:MraZ protein
MFRGRHEHSVDEKGRISIPSRFRDHLESKGCTTLIVTNFDKCLVCYPLDEWMALETKFSQLPQFDPKVVAFQRYFISGASECSLDRSGRILLPQSLRDFLKIEKNCYIVGAINKFEIWSDNAWKDQLSSLSENIMQVSAEISQMGIPL